MNVHLNVLHVRSRLKHRINGSRRIIVRTPVIVTDWHTHIGKDLTCGVSIILLALLRLIIRRDTMVDRRVNRLSYIHSRRFLDTKRTISELLVRRVEMEHRSIFGSDDKRDYYALGFLETDDLIQQNIEEIVMWGDGDD